MRSEIFRSRDIRSPARFNSIVTRIIRDGGDTIATATVAAATRKEEERKRKTVKRSSNQTSGISDGNPIGDARASRRCRIRAAAIISRTRRPGGGDAIRIASICVYGTQSNFSALIWGWYPSIRMPRSGKSGSLGTGIRDSLQSTPPPHETQSAPHTSKCTPRALSLYLYFRRSRRKAAHLTPSRQTIRAPTLSITDEVTSACWPCNRANDDAGLRFSCAITRSDTQPYRSSYSFFQAKMKANERKETRLFARTNLTRYENSCLRWISADARRT